MASTKAYDIVDHSYDVVVAGQALHLFDTEHAFDDFAGGDVDMAANKALMGID